MLSRLSITRQFTLLGICGIAIALIVLAISLDTIYGVALQARKNQVRDMIQAAVTSTEAFVALAESGKMTTAEAQHEALLAISAARYEDGNYYYVYDYNGLTLAHPDKSYLGTNRYRIRDSYGNWSNAPVIDGAKAGHPVFNQYYAPRANQTVPKLKISYGMAIPQWGWVICTGLYVDDLRTAVLLQLVRLGEIILPLFCALLIVIMLLRRAVSGLLRTMSESMERLAKGAFDTVVPGLDRQDDLGRMAKAVAVFREAGLEKHRLEVAAEAAQAEAAAARARADSTRDAAAQEQAMVVTSLATGLERLSGGDLAFRLETPFDGQYEKLRGDFNAAMVKLQETIAAIAGVTQAVSSGAGEITQASDDLSRRTEHQAASLEQTAAALDAITNTVRKSAAGAQEANAAVAVAKTDAEHSGTVLQQTVAAMGEIEGSARQISTIIGVIDEIAFQTNLLALNAGVEAARAGDSGKGFAVVATEVRALAQRSADAAKEIKSLISMSGKQVEAGAALVGETGRAVARIVDQVARVNQLVGEIAASAQEQATGLNQVNTAVTQMDQVTQQNAAMVEETTAASHSLAHEATELARLISRFDLGRLAQSRAPAAA